MSCYAGETIGMAAFGETVADWEAFFDAEPMAQLLRYVDFRAEQIGLAGNSWSLIAATTTAAGMAAIDWDAIPEENPQSAVQQWFKEAYDRTREVLEADEVRDCKRWRWADRVALLEDLGEVDGVTYSGGAYTITGLREKWKAVRDGLLAVLDGMDQQTSDAWESVGIGNSVQSVGNEEDLHVGYASSLRNTEEIEVTDTCFAITPPTATTDVYLNDSNGFPGLTAPPVGCTEVPDIFKPLGLSVVWGGPTLLGVFEGDSEENEVLAEEKQLIPSGPLFPVPCDCGRGWLVTSKISQDFRVGLSGNIAAEDIEVEVDFTIDAIGCIATATPSSHTFTVPEGQTFSETITVTYEITEVTAFDVGDPPLSKGSGFGSTSCYEVDDKYGGASVQSDFDVWTGITPEVSADPVFPTKPLALCRDACGKVHLAP